MTAIQAMARPLIVGGQPVTSGEPPLRVDNPFTGDAAGFVHQAGEAEAEAAMEAAQRSFEVPLDVDAEVWAYQAGTGERRQLAMASYVPLGPVLAIAPFNFPLNLTLHKAAPAVAAGNPVVLKAVAAGPLTGLRLGELLVAAGMPREAARVHFVNRAADRRAALTNRTATVRNVNRRPNQRRLLTNRTASLQRAG